MKWTDALCCVGSTPGKKPVNPGDLSNEDVFFSDFSLAKINARSEALVMALGRSPILRIALGLGSCGGSEDGK